MPSTSLREGKASPRIVTLGGGTGLPIVLKGLRTILFSPGRRPVPASDRDRLTAIVTVADDGGSSGRLRRAYRVPPPGDARNCLLALCRDDSDLASIFSFRFNGHDDRGLTGHSLGNLILTALWQAENDFSGAIRRAGRLLGIRGRVLPATLDDVTLAAELADGERIEGESRIAATRRTIRRVMVRPSGARAHPEALQAIGQADLIVLGPGSLYTSLIPILLIRDLAEAIGRCRARVVLVMNLMAEPGETDGYGAGDFVRAIHRHATRIRIETVLINDAPISPDHLEMYARQGAAPIRSDLEALKAWGCRPIARDLLGTGQLVRHDPEKLARALLAVAVPSPRAAWQEMTRSSRADAPSHPTHPPEGVVS